MGRAWRTCGAPRYGRITRYKRIVRRLHRAPLHSANELAGRICGRLAGDCLRFEVVAGSLARHRTNQRTARNRRQCGLQECGLGVGEGSARHRHLRGNADHHRIERAASGRAFRARCFGTRGFGGVGTGPAYRVGRTLHPVSACSCQYRSGSVAAAAVSALRKFIELQPVNCPARSARLPLLHWSSSKARRDGICKGEHREIGLGFVQHPLE